MIDIATREDLSLVERLRRKVQGGLELIESSPLAVPALLHERLIEAAGGHPTEADNRAHIREAIAWLERAQDAGQGGIARGYSLALVPGLGPRGWQAAYPETTGYIIPTLYAAAWAEERPWLAMRATRAARWELTVQRLDGAIPAGMVGQGTAPAVFNTGQVIFGWLCALREVGDGLFAGAAHRAARWLAQQLDIDGVWRRGNSPFAHSGTTLYNARTAWALLAAGKHLEEPEFAAAGTTALSAVAKAQYDNGWLPDCCLSDAKRPLTHTLAYAVQGLLEGGALLGDERLIAAAARTADPMADALRSDGFLPGRFDAKWRPAVSWSCLTGTAQMASVWLRLGELTGDAQWSGPAAAALHFLKRTQNRTTTDPGLRGGIKGSNPCTGDYGRLQTLSWATKFFIDALLRQQIGAHGHIRSRAAACLALA
jgi:hypothetical protein